MDGVLEEAAVLCACKLVGSLLVLPSLAASYSPVSFCSCCLLIFTDFLVTVFLSFLHIFESWLTELTPQGDAIALRFLLFLSRTYGAVLLLTTPLIAVETLIRVLWPRVVITGGTASQADGPDGQRCYVVEREEEEDGTHPEKDKRVSHVVSYLCCLSVWVVVALNVKWRWRMEEEWTAACLHTTNSLIKCLPNLFSPVPSAMNPCWGMAFLFFLLLLVSSSAGLQRRHKAAAQAEAEAAPADKDAAHSKGEICYFQDLESLLSAAFRHVNPGISASELVQCVDPEKTESSCSVPSQYSWNSVQMSACRHGDFGLVSPECLSGRRGGQEHERTKRGIPLTFITEEHVDSQYRSRCGWRQRGFPCQGAKVMIGFVCVLSIFVLPLNLSVNILLIRTLETMLEQCIESLTSSPAGDTSTPYKGTLV
ncbi:uncharacterized protein LOC125006370 isoform X2 [Mugil cephalus]|nr:uncharacterized protein LOC125006370 isoform X2 [Mugil cephalus]